MIGAKFFSDIVLHRGGPRCCSSSDLAQLPPIGEPAQRSPVFDRVQFQVHLSEVVRQAAENPSLRLHGRQGSARGRRKPAGFLAPLKAVPASASNIGIITLNARYLGRV